MATTGVKPPTPGAKSKGVIKRAPKWAWFTVGGIVIGVLVIKLWRDRATDATASVEVGTTEGQYPQSSSGGLIVPPVIVSPPMSDPNIGVPALQDAFISAIGDMAQGWRDVYGPIADLIPGLIPTPDQYLSMIAGGGGQQQSPVVVTVPGPQQAAPAPAPGPAAAPAPTAAPQVAPCPAGYPYRSDRGCYKVVCASGKGDHSKGHWHYYSNGAEIHVDNSC